MHKFEKLSILTKNTNKWPLLYTSSDTTGEKDFEEFFTENEILHLDSFEGIGIIKNDPVYDEKALTNFEENIVRMRHELSWTKAEIVALFRDTLLDFSYEEIGRNLDTKM